MDSSREKRLVRQGGMNPPEKLETQEAAELTPELLEMKDAVEAAKTKIDEADEKASNLQKRLDSLKHLQEKIRGGGSIEDSDKQILAGEGLDETAGEVEIQKKAGEMTEEHREATEELGKAHEELKEMKEKVGEMGLTPEELAAIGLQGPSEAIENPNVGMEEALENFGKALGMLLGYIKKFMEALGKAFKGDSLDSESEEEGSGTPEGGPDAPSEGSPGNTEKSAVRNEIMEKGVADVKDEAESHRDEAKQLLDVGAPGGAPGLNDQMTKLLRKKVNLEKAVKDKQKLAEENPDDATAKKNLKNAERTLEDHNLGVKRVEEDIAQQERSLDEAKKKLDAIDKIVEDAKALRDTINKVFTNVADRLDALPSSSAVDGLKAALAGVKVKAVSVMPPNDKLEMQFNGQFDSAVDSAAIDKAAGELGIDADAFEVGAGRTIKDPEAFITALQKMVVAVENDHKRVAEAVEGLKGKGASPDVAEQALLLNKDYDLGLDFEGGVWRLQEADDEGVLTVKVSKAYVQKHGSLHKKIEDVFKNYLKEALQDITAPRGEIAMKTLLTEKYGGDWANPEVHRQLVALAREIPDFKSLTLNATGGINLPDVAVNKDKVKNSELHAAGNLHTALVKFYGLT